MNKGIIIAGLLALSAGLFFLVKKKKCGCVSSVTNNLLIVGTNAEYPPFTFIQNGEITGLDIDLMKEVAKRLGKEIEWRDMPFTTLLPQLQMGNIQIIAAGLTPTAERAKQAFFATPHLQGEAFVIVARKPNKVPETLEGLKGKNLIVNEGFVADEYLTKNGIEARKLPTVADAFLALQSGRADFFVSGKAPLKPFFDQYGTNDFEIEPLVGAPQESVALLVSKQHSELFKQIDQMVQQIAEDGTLTALKRKWGFEQ